MQMRCTRGASCTLRARELSPALALTFTVGDPHLTVYAARQCHD
jgi:hypothetical protein